MKQSVVVLSLLFILLGSGCSSLPPMADIHLHYNWDQEELVAVEDAVRMLRESNVTLAIVTATPAVNALKLRKAGGDWIYPILSPYLSGYSRHNWYRDPKLISKMRTLLQSGKYYGIGELHLVVGLGAGPDSDVFKGITGLAREFNIPILIHAEAASHEFFARVCEKHHDVRFLWAHAGSILGPEANDKVLARCKNVWVELSARDPHHYGSFLNKDGSIPEGWLKVFKKYPDRFMTGTDPVWKAQELHRWDRADEGWKHYKMFNDFHRGWLSQLPGGLQEKITLTNAQAFWLGKQMTKQ